MELLAYSFRNIGENGEAAKFYRMALEADPKHARAASWKQHVQECELDARSGVGILRPNTITPESVRADPKEVYKNHPDRGVLCTKDQWQKPDDYIPPKTLANTVGNFLPARKYDLLPLVGTA